MAQGFDFAESAASIQNEGQVESPENLGSKGETDQPDAAPQKEELMDLGSVKRFRFEGREWTPKELRSAYMAHADYTRKTQALAEEKKFISNYRYDLEQVKKDPRLAEAFKKVYPEDYHYLLEPILRQAQQPTRQTQEAQTRVSPEWEERISRIENDVSSQKQELHERQVNAINAELDSKFQKLAEKYPMADEEAVVARAQALHDRGEKLTDQVWDSLWRSHHEKMSGYVNKLQSERFKEQKAANIKGKDMGSGGGIPGQAPRIPKTIKEARDLMLKDLDG